jgi:ATP-dependent DNA helicase HFM1/MER3
LLFLDPKYYCWFPYESFNQIQQQSLPSILESDENILISAPTGSGKTALFELAMIRLFETQPIKKIVYLSPMRALCTEKYTLWSEKLSSIGKSCIELIGGDNNNFTKEQVEEADLYITTPEKWDYMTRSSNFIDSIGLVLVKKNLKMSCCNYILD